MKKIIVTILIFMFTGTVANCQGLFASEDSGNSVGLFSEPSSSPGGDSGYGLFSSSNDPFDRPGIGGGIGEDKGDSPVGDGIIVLVVCSAILVVMKVFSTKKFRRKPVFTRAKTSLGKC